MRARAATTGARDGEPAVHAALLPIVGGICRADFATCGPWDRLQRPLLKNRGVRYWINSHRRRRLVVLAPIEAPTPRHEPHRCRT